MVIAPQAVSRFGRLKGSMQTPNGTISVSYEKADGKIHFVIDVPKNTEAIFKLGEFEKSLSFGKNEFTV